MNKLHLLIFILSISFISAANSQSPLEGIWQGNLESEFQSAQLSWKFSDEKYDLDMNIDGTIEVSGKWEIRDDRLYLWDLSGPMACPESQTGIYDFTITDNTMILSLVEDDCLGRKMMGPNVSWIKK